MTPRPLHPARALLLALLLCAPAASARAQDDAPGGWREMQAQLRDAVRDTAGHGEDPGRLSALGRALLRLGRWNDAEKVLRRVLAARPDDRSALAGLGKMALYRHRVAEAESLLAAAGDAEGAVRDLYASRLRRGDWKGAAALAEAAGDAGHLPLLERLQSVDAFVLRPGPEAAELGFERAFPVPLVRVKLNGQQVLAAIDPGSPNVLVDRSALGARGIDRVPGERAVFWVGSHVAARNGIARRIELGGITIANVPVAITSLHRYSLDVNPMGRDIGLVIGLPLLERLGVTLDFPRQRLELRRGGVPAADGYEQRVPWERWTANHLVVWGSIGGGRRLSLIVGTGLPGGGFGGPADVFDELGLRPGKMSNLMRGPGMLMQGRPWVQVGVPTLSVGSVVGERVNGWLGAMDPGEAWRQGTRLDGLLGPEWFRGRRVTFDWDRRELVIQGRD